MVIAPSRIPQRQVKVLVLGVNPFEDLPGFQIVSLIRASKRHAAVLADDSRKAVRLLAEIGMLVHALPDPSIDASGFAAAVERISNEEEIDLIVPGCDAHLFALAAYAPQYPTFIDRCPQVGWISDLSIKGKWECQEWISHFGQTPKRWRYAGVPNSNDLCTRFPAMLKGIRKGAILCEEGGDVSLAAKTLLRNRANAGSDGGLYFEDHVDGAEYCLFLLIDESGRVKSQCGIRKLATTQLGTTVVGEVTDTTPGNLDLTQLVTHIRGPAVVEIEWRQDAFGHSWIFEVNLRFPSWISAIPSFGTKVVDAYIEAVLGSSSPGAAPIADVGTLFYRLPQSGPFGLTQFVESASLNRAGSKPRLPLWRSSSPHQFLVK